MNRRTTLIGMMIIVLLASAALALHAQIAAALPEYSAQTGEPCYSCHLSPSGGGPRGPRGQAWVGSGKPGAIPDLTQSLELLGIELEMDEARYQPPSAPPVEGRLPADITEDAASLRRLLNRYDGN